MKFIINDDSDDDRNDKNNIIIQPKIIIADEQVQEPPVDCHLSPAVLDREEEVDVEQVRRKEQTAVIEQQHAENAPLADNEPTVVDVLEGEE